MIGHPHLHETLLVVDDEEATLRAMKRTLRSKGYQSILTATSGAKALHLLEKHPVSVMLLDLIMPEMSGLEVLHKLKADLIEVPVLVITAQQEIDTAVACMKLGARDYLVKPVEPDRLLTSIHHALTENELRRECQSLRQNFLEGNLQRPEIFSEILTTDASMQRIFNFIEAVAPGSHPVLITGETGTGKELLARALHDASDRRGPFVAINVGGLDDTMFSDTMFGHAKGAFTGADASREGAIHAAGNGTLFLDEIGELEESAQIKLLRVLQEREYFPLGSDKLKQVQARIVTATNKDPESLRKDLYYRLRGCCVRVPPLRRRMADLPQLVSHFVRLAAVDLGKSEPSIPPELFLHLADHPFPGNIRELQGLVFQAVARNQSAVIPLQLFLDELPLHHQADGEVDNADCRIAFPFPMPTLRSIEERAVEEALRRMEGNQSAAARMLDVSRPTIGRHAQRLKGEGP